MKARVADTLRSFGFEGSVEDFRTALAEVKAEHFANWSIDELTYTRDEAAEFCTHVRKKLSAPKLTRVFILRALVGLRKNGGARKKAVASLGDGQATT